jgi:hypothetical protein
VTLERQSRVLRLHPFPIVLDLHLLLATELDVNPYPPRARIQGVLDQFLDDRGGPLDHFAGRDLVG